MISGHLDGMRDAQLALAREIAVFARTGYGPRGGTKLVVEGDELVLRDSPAAALREIHLGDPLARPYKNLAAGVHAAVGDGGTTALLLAARLVTEAFEEQVRGLPRQVSLEGYELARRQAAATLQAGARDSHPDQMLGELGDPATVQVVIAGLQQLGHDLHGTIDLDRIDIRVEAGAPRWLEGLVVEPKVELPARERLDARVLVLTAPLVRELAGAKTEVRSMAGLEAARDAEARREAGILAALDGLGVQLLATTHAVDEGLVQRLAGRGVMVVDNLAATARLRIEQATGATPCAQWVEATPNDLGTADLRRRPVRLGGWSLEGPGPSATFAVPAAPGAEKVAAEQAERLLRAAGPILADARGLPGGGRWQRDVAAALRRAAPLADGKRSLAVQAAARVFDALADDLLRNQGMDPLDGPLTLPAPPDAYVAIQRAVDGAFEVARQILRVDARHDKRPSSQEALRGGGSHIGSPKGMPGDVPPLM